jgi:hypothetical protein
LRCYIYQDSEESNRIKDVKKFLLKFDIPARLKGEMSSGGDFLRIRNRFENKFREIYRCNSEIDFAYSSSGEEHHKRWRIEKCSIKDTQTGEYAELKGVKSDKWFSLIRKMMPKLTPLSRRMDTWKRRSGNYELNLFRKSKMLRMNYTFLW